MDTRKDYRAARDAAAVVLALLCSTAACGGDSKRVEDPEACGTTSTVAKEAAQGDAPRDGDRIPDPTIGLPIWGTYAPPPTPSPAPAPAPYPATPPGAAIVVDEALLMQLAACWFSSPYEYMFGSWGGGTVSVGGKSFGSFDAGIFGMLYYSDLNTCVGKVTGVPPKNYADAEPFATLAGLPLYGPQADASKPFGYYNPDLVKWGHEHLIPDAGSTLSGVPVKKVYSVVFARFFRMMTESYLFLAQSGKYQAEMDAYAKMPYGTDGVDWLQKRYAGKLAIYGGSWDGTTMTPQMAIGFWLRRGIDGTGKELWVGLRKVMTRYDADWYAGLKKTYTSPDIEW